MKRLALLLLLAGCNQQEIADLDASIERLDAERARLSEIARDAGAWHDKKRRIDEALERAKKDGYREPPSILVERLRADSALVLEARAAGGWTAGRDEPPSAAVASLKRAAAVAPYLVISRVEIEEGRWWIEIPADDFAMRDIPALPDPRATPTPARLPNTAAGRRRIQIERLQREVSELDKIVGELKDVDRREHEWKIAESIAIRSDRLSTIAHVASILTGQRLAPLRDLSLEPFDHTRFKFGGWPRKGLTSSEASAAIRSVSKLAEIATTGERLIGTLPDGLRQGSDPSSH